MLKKRMKWGLFNLSVTCIVNQGTFNYGKSECYNGHMKWIPVKEQKPHGGHILITVLWEKGVDTAFDDDYEVIVEDWGVGEYEIKEGTAKLIVKRMHERTIAWMPMPEPYNPNTYKR